MNTHKHTSEFTLTPFDNRRLANLCGRFDEHLRQIEHHLHIEILNRGNNFIVKGEANAIDIAMQVLKKLYIDTKRNIEITPNQVHLSMQHFERPVLAKIKVNNESKNPGLRIKLLENGNIFRSRLGEVKSRNQSQVLYIQNILQHDINFGIGPAGTGKTFLAVACAVAALEQEIIRRIILVRPAVEAGERLGFLPGDLTQKIDPYLRPLYDALYEMLGAEKVTKLIENHVIEIAPLAYMRGRTLNDAFIILDESQNTTNAQMKMFLTRMGFNSIAVITGDITQIDLPHGTQSGLQQAMQIVKASSRISFTHFASSDVVRHPVVQEIIEAYECYEAKSTLSSHEDIVWP